MVPPLKGSIRRVTVVNTSRPIGRSEAYAERDARTVALDRGATEFVIQAGVAQADSYFLQKVIRLQHIAGRVVKFEASARESAARQLRAQVIGQALARPVDREVQLPVSVRRDCAKGKAELASLAFFAGLDRPGNIRHRRTWVDCGPQLLILPVPRGKTWLPIDRHCV